MIAFRTDTSAAATNAVPQSRIEMPGRIQAMNQKLTALTRNSVTYRWIGIRRDFEVSVDGTPLRLVVGRRGKRQRRGWRSADLTCRDETRREAEPINQGRARR